MGMPQVFKRNFITNLNTSKLKQDEGESQSYIHLIDPTL